MDVTKSYETDSVENVSLFSFPYQKNSKQKFSLEDEQNIS